MIDMSSIKVYSDDPSNDAYQHEFLAFRPMMEIASDTYSLIVTRNPRTDSSLSDEQVRCLKDTVRAELESTSTTSIASKMCRSWPNLFLGVVNQTTNDGVYEEFDELAHEIAGRVMSDGSLKNIPYEVMTPEYNHHGKLGLSIRQEEVVCHWVISSVAVSVKLSTTEGEPISTDLLHDLRFSSPAVDADATANPE